jgi:hypothetical protein
VKGRARRYHGVPRRRHGGTWGRGACARDVARSARLLQTYELDFWLAASEPPGSPLPVHRPAP